MWLKLYVSIASSYKPETLKTSLKRGNGGVLYASRVYISVLLLIDIIESKNNSALLVSFNETLQETSCRLVRFRPQIILSS